MSGPEAIGIEPPSSAGSDPRASRLKRRTIWLQILISALCLAWLISRLQDIAWTAAFEALARASLGLIAGSLLLTVCVYGIRLSRLRYWCERLARDKLPLAHWVDLYLKSVAFGSLTPARLGDFSRILLLVRSGLSLVERSRLVVVDKIADLLYIPLAIAFAVNVVALKFGVSRGWTLLVGTCLLLALLGASRIGARFLSLRDLSLGWLATAVAFLLFVESNALLFWSVGIELSLSEVTAIIIVVAVLANLPLSIGGIGVREASLFSLLELWGVQAEVALPLLLLEFFLNVIFPVLLYFSWLCASNLIPSWSEFKIET